jgi:flagellar hook-associated protein 3 FlgL
MRVTFNSGFDNALHAVSGAAQRLQERQREVSTGRKLHVPSDNPSAAAGVIAEKAEMGVLDRFVQSGDTADARLRVMDTVLSTVVTQVTAAITQAAAGRSTALTPEARAATALAVTGLRDSILSSINSQYQGTYLFSGARATTQPYVKSGSTISSYQGDATVVSVDISRSQTVATTIDGNTVLRGSDPDDVFTILTNVASAVQTGNSAGIDAGIAALNRAFSRVTDVQSRVGSDLAVLTEERSRLREMHRASDTRRSTLEDANLVESISGMNAATQAHEAALSALGRSSRLTLLDYLR